MPDVVAGVVAARRVREDELQRWNYVEGIRSVTLLGQASWSVGWCTLRSWADWVQGQVQDR
jgi:hypothetical protein